MTPLPLSRREALRRILAASALASVLDIQAFAADDLRIIGDDPDLLKKEIPWARVLTDEEKRTVTAFADLLIPADEYGPAASAVGVTDFIDEWVSAPYEQQKGDLVSFRKGLAWLNDESKRRTSKLFADSTLAEQTALLEDTLKAGTEARKAGYSFFKLFRDRACGGYFSTPDGAKALGYQGNVPLISFAGPPPEALRHVGLA